MTKKILVVEDEQLLRKALSDKLANAGYEVVEATDGEEGLRLADIEHPDLILLDIVMPKMDGMTMLKKLRLDEWGKTAEVIILTNLTEVEKIEEGSKGEASDYLIKTDWKLEDVLEKVRQKLSQD